jgi:hypothetical protein
MYTDTETLTPASLVVLPDEVRRDQLAWSERSRVVATSRLNAILASERLRGYETDEITNADVKGAADDAYKSLVRQGCTTDNGEFQLWVGSLGTYGHLSVVVLHRSESYITTKSISVSETGRLV